MSRVTEILDAVAGGTPRAAEALLPLVYDELRRLAAVKMSAEKPGQTLDATGLVHEAYLRLVGSETPQQWNGRGHFFAAAAEAMRRILVERARHNHCEKHGGGRSRVELKENAVAATSREDDVLAVDEALDRLAAHDAEAAELVKLHFFAGLSIDEAASVLGISPRTAYRNWNYAKAWLYRQMEGERE